MRADRPEKAPSIVRDRTRHVRPTAPRESSLKQPLFAGRIVIVGAGGFGRETLRWAHDAWPDLAPRIAGFLSASEHDLRHRERLPPILGDPVDFQPRADDALLLAIGIPFVRRRVAELLETRGGTFVTLIHPTATVASSATIGAGSILCPNSVVSDSARLGRHVLVNYHASLGHDASAGDFAVLSPYATLGGDAHIDEDVFLGMHATVGPGVRVGARSKVSANSSALSNAAAESIIYGVPGRISPRIELSAPPRRPHD